MAKFKPYSFSVLDDLGLDIPKDRQREALETAREFLKEQMLDYIAEGKSPVSGGEWVRGLTKDYKAIKGEESSSDFANLELSGHLLDNLEVSIKGTDLVFDVDHSDYGKAEGHITGVYGDHSKRVRPRQFMPQGNEGFKRNILSELKNILEDFEE